MKMIRTICHIAGKDYEKYDQVCITFNVQCVSIANFLSIIKGEHCYVQSYSSVFLDPQRTNTDGTMKTFIICGAAYNTIQIALKLGKHECDNMHDVWNIRNTALRAYDGVNCPRYAGILCFDPVTKITTMKTNSPIKITGTQIIFNGKLWRKYFTKSMH